MFEELIKKALKIFPIKKQNRNHIDLYDDLINKAQKYFTEKEVLMIKKAYLIADDLHRGQKRNSGEPYIIHPLHVAYTVLEEMNLRDVNTIIASLLHDTIEDCGITEELIAKYFNQDVANLVVGVTKMKDLDFTSKEEKEDYNNYLLLKNILKDYRIIYIKLADRLHNMRTLDYKNESKRREKSAETLRIFAPLATHVGISLVRDELIDTSFKYLSDRNYREIKGMSDDYLIKHQAKIEKILNHLRDTLTSLGIEPIVRAHIMNNFAIYQSLIQNKKISLLPNLIYFNILVNNQEEIDKVLAEIKKDYTILEIKDYIKTPRANGYQALHLSIKGRKSPFQIRIFTREMFLVNSYGFSALLDIYPNKSISEIQEDLIKSNPFFQSLNRNYKLYKKPFELIDTTVRGLLADKINVYVADGSVYCLPSMSTVGDLADKIHSKLKAEAIGAIVNSIEDDVKFPPKDKDHVVIITREKEIAPSLTLKKEETFR